MDTKSSYAAIWIFHNSEHLTSDLSRQEEEQQKCCLLLPSGPGTVW